MIEQIWCGKLKSAKCMKIATINMWEEIKFKETGRCRSSAGVHEQQSVKEDIKQKMGLRANNQD